MKRLSMLLLLMGGVVLMAGCGGEEESYSRYPSQCIPMYEPRDYIEMLSAEDPEWVYNAICILGYYADEFGDALWGEHKDEEPEPEELNQAQDAYTEVCAQIRSEHPMIVAASLRFLQLFAGGHDERSELIDPVCRINSDHPLVQFEQVELLKRLVDDSTRLPEPLLRRLMDSKSWIVSRSSYDLIGALNDEPLQKELIARYHATQEEKERLLVLCALGEHAGPEVIELAKQEVFSAASTNISMMACMLLNENLDAPGVFVWFVDHYSQLAFYDDEVPDDIFELVFAVNDKGRSEAARILLEKGYVPGDAFLKRLNKRFEDEADQLPEYLLGIEEELLAVPEVASRWQALRQKSAENNQIYRISQEELEPLKVEFMEKVRVVLTRYDVPEPDQKTFLKSISGLDLKKTVGALGP